MSLLDDARRLAEVEPNGGQFIDQYCVACQEYIGLGGKHSDTCPWLSMSKIVSVLETAERLIPGPPPTYWEWEQGTIMPVGYGGGTVLKCAHCHRKIHEHETDCPWQALVAALRGEEAKA